MRKPRRSFGRYVDAPNTKSLNQSIEELNLVKASFGDGVTSPWDALTPVPIENRHYVDITKDTEGLRRAIHTLSAYYNTLGIYRSDFNKEDSDRLARNAHYAMCEKAMLDYVSTVEFEVRDQKGKGDLVDKPMDFLNAPNPQSDFQDLLKPVVRDTIRYDAGVWVKTMNRKGHLVEVKPYLGTEFWKEIDRATVTGGLPGQMKDWQSYWSHGYVKRYWQRARIGLFIPYHPEEICYFMMYPRSDGIYGFDFLKTLRYQIQFLIDSTRAAGKTFYNGIVPSLVWSHPDIINRHQLTEKMKETELMNRGSYKFGSTLHTVANEDVKTISNTLVDMQWLEGQKYVAALIWGMWGFSSSEFIDSDTNRAEAYVSRNITKSRMLRPILKYFERKINTEVLPYLKGYKKDWHFRFVSDTDLSEELQMAQINATKASTVSTYASLGVPVSLAIKIARAGDDLTTAERESLDSYGIGAMDVDGTPLKADGTPSGDNNKYMPVDLQQGRYNRADGSSTANPDYSKEPDHTEQERSETKEMMKAGRVYISDPSKAPKNARVARGDRGGYYYIRDDSEQTRRKDESAEPRQSRRDDKKKRAREVDEPMSIKNPLPEGEEVKENAEFRRFHLFDDSGNVSVIVYEQYGRISAYTFDTGGSQQIVSQLVENAPSQDYNGYLASAKALSKEHKLNLEEQ